MKKEIKEVKKVAKNQMACVYANDLIRNGMKRNAAFKLAWNIVKFIIYTKEDWGKEKGDVKVKYWSNYGKERLYYTCSWLSSYANKGNYIEYSYAKELIGA